MFGYRSQASSSAWFHRSMFGSAYGPAVSNDLALIQSTGSPSATCIIRSMRRSRPKFEPAATFAASFVPSASTQQPSKPRSCHALATS